MEAEKVSLSMVGDRLAELVREYGDRVKDQGLIALEEAAESAKTEASALSPVGDHGGHHLKDAWTITQIGTGYSTTYYVWAGKWHRASIVHLIENGHAINRSTLFQPKAGMKPVALFTRPNPFMSAVQTDAADYFIETLKTMIENGVEP